MLLAAVTNHLVDVLLRGHEQPSPSAALSVERLSDGLKVQHQLCVGTDELPDFVDEEVQSVAHRLLVQPGAHFLGEVLDRNRIRVLIGLQDVGSSRCIQTGNLCVRLINLATHGREPEARTALHPFSTRNLTEGILEGV